MGLCRKERGLAAARTGKLNTVPLFPMAGLPAAEEHVEEASTWDSNCRSCPMKLKLGEMMLRRCLTNSKASSSLTRLVRIRYARQMVAEREIPAWQ